MQEIIPQTASSDNRKNKRLYGSDAKEMLNFLLAGEDNKPLNYQLHHEPEYLVDGFYENELATWTAFDNTSGACNVEEFGQMFQAVDWLNKYSTREQGFAPHELVDGRAYKIHLKINAREIYNAVYRHCTLTGKHYFVKGDETFLLEDVMCHSLKSHEASTDTSPQIFTDYYCSHLIKVTFTSVIPANTLQQIPDSVYDNIMEALKENVSEGKFTEEETGDNLYMPGEDSSDDNEVYTVCAGSWRIVELDFHLISRLVMWWNNSYSKKLFNYDLFIRYFGETAGTEYYVEWLDRKENLIDMFGCFVSEHEDGQIFCNMLMEQIEEYEKEEQQRIKHE